MITTLMSFLWANPSFGDACSACDWWPGISVSVHNYKVDNVINFIDAGWERHCCRLQNVGRRTRVDSAGLVTLLAARPLRAYILAVSCLSACSRDVAAAGATAFQCKWLRCRCLAWTVSGSCEKKCVMKRCTDLWC